MYILSNLLHIITVITLIIDKYVDEIFHKRMMNEFFFAIVRLVTCPFNLKTNPTIATVPTSSNF